MSEVKYKPIETLATREGWLNNAVGLLRPHFEEHGLELPPLLKTSCGWPASGGLKAHNRVIGQCWNADAAEDGVTQIFISPWLAKAVEALETLVHELVHAALPEAKHGKAFAKAAYKVGLEGKPTHTVAGVDLKAKLEALAETLGPYPHSRLSKPAKEKVQSTRMLKLVCPKQAELHEPGQEYILRASRKVVDLGLGTCGVCGETLEVSETPGKEGAE